LEKLGNDYSERTVRRWLDQLTREGVVEKIGQRRARKYLAVKHANMPSDELSSCFSLASSTVVDKVRRPLFDRVPVTYDQGWLDSYQPNSSYYISEKLREQLFQAGRRATAQDPAGTYAHRIFNRLLIDLSYNSSRLEGNTYSLLDTERLLLHGKGGEGKLELETVMILNHKEAIRYLVDNAPQLEVSRNAICTLHYLLSEGLVEPQYTGKVRDHGVRIGGSTYIPIEGSKRLEQALEAIAMKAAHIRDPFEQSCFLLAHVNYLQAFADVNKRTARLSANIPLVKGNLVPLAFNDVKVEDYMSAMIAIYELKDVRPLVDLYVYSYLRTCAAYDSTVKALGFDEVRVRYRRQRRDIVREVIQQGLVGREMQALIVSEAGKQVPDNERQAFIEDILEDLEYVDEVGLVGLGVSVDQLQRWIKRKGGSKVDPIV
jgi:Fic family protein